MTKSDDTKERIIQATVRVAIAKGFANARTAEIAREAGVSEGLIFKYFPTKGHLFALVINDNFQRLKTGLELIINNRTLTASEKLVNLISFHFNFFTIERNIAQLLVGHSDTKSIGIHPEAIIEFGLRPYIQLVSKILSEGIKAAEFRTLNVEVMATVIIGSMQLPIVNKVLFGGDYDLEEAKREITNYILKGLKI